MRSNNKDNFKVKELRKDVYAITNATVNMYLLVGSSHALLFDTGYGFANLKECVEQITNLPLYVVNSHGHIDHSGGNNAFDGPIYIHEADLKVYLTHNSPKLHKIGLDGIRSIQKILFWMEFLPKHMDESAYINQPYFNNFLFVKEGYVFELGGMTAEVFEIPGHTPGSIGLLVKEKRLFFCK